MTEIRFVLSIFPRLKAFPLCKGCDPYRCRWPCAKEVQRRISKAVI